jgi:hypothetical protein
MAKNEFFFTTTTTHDLPFMWVAYKNGDFKSANPDIFDPSKKLNLEDFTTAYLEYLSSHNLLSFTLFLDKGDKKITPIGNVIMWAVCGRMMILGDMVWFHWSNPRNILEASINFFDTWRKTQFEGTDQYYKIIEFARESDSKFFDILVRKGILEKGSNMLGIYPDQGSVTYSTTPYFVSKREKGVA